MHHHSRQGSQPATVPIASPPIWSQHALRAATRLRPLQNILTSPVAADFLKKALTTDERAHDLRAEGRLLPAERLAARAEAQRRHADAQQQHVTLLVSLGAGEQIQLPALNLNDAAAWLYHTPPALQVLALTTLITADQVGSAEELLDRIDEALLSDQTGDTYLQQLLDAGLQSRLGKNLTTFEERVFRYLLATGTSPSTTSVCETCALVVNAPRSRQCLPCRRSPPRPKPRPWHRRITITTGRRAPVLHALTVGAGGAWVTNRRLPPTPRVIYHVVCACGQPFTTNDARQRYCAQCGKPSARTARHRSTQQAADRDPPSSSAITYFTATARRIEASSTSLKTATVSFPTQRD
jgi:hypothetical protein